jgi:REP element-mobilizing transposase RayT
MPSPPRLLLPHSVVFITTRMEEGLPLIPTDFIKVIIEGILGRAYKKYRIIACHYIFMNNHLHLLLVVEDPDAVAGFMDRLKTETAHAVNRLLGRRKKTVWYDDYDAVPILTVEDCIEKIAYIYTNPQKADLVESIEEYPGVSSWKLYREGKKGFVARWIQRPMISKLPNMAMSLNQQKSFAQTLLKKSKKRVVFRIFPDAWMKCFGITGNEKMSSINKCIIDRIRQLELKHKTDRATAGKTVIGAHRLKVQPIDKPYAPQKFGRRMWCICRDVAIRVAFICSVKELRRQAKLVRKRWLLGDFSLPFPIGLFPPRMARLANSIVGVGC